MRWRLALLGLLLAPALLVGGCADAPAVLLRLPVAPSTTCAQHEQPLLIAFIGQSNMVGQGDAGGAADGGTTDAVLDVGTGSLVPSFARRVRVETSANVEPVKAARNGAGWVYEAEGRGTWAPTGALMERALRRLDTAVANTGRPLAGIVALGGESDAFAAATGALVPDEFVQGFRSTIRVLHLRYRAPIFFILPGYLGFAPTPPGHDEGTELVRSLMATVVAEPEFEQFASVVAVDVRPLRDAGTRFMNGDGLHFNQQGLDFIGSNAGAAIAERISGRPRSVGSFRRTPSTCRSGSRAASTPSANSR